MRFDGAALARTLKTESDLLGVLVSLLRDEQQAVVRGDLDRLASFAESKTIHLSELMRLGGQRQELLRENGLTPDREGMACLLRGCTAAAPQARPEWERLLELTATAHHLNETNGALIRTRLAVTQRALGVLMSAAKISGAYAPDGSTVCYRTRQQLAVA